MDFVACHNSRATSFVTFLLLGIAMTYPLDEDLWCPTEVLEPVTGVDVAEEFPQRMGDESASTARQSVSK